MEQKLGPWTGFFARTPTWPTATPCIHCGRGAIKKQREGEGICKPKREMELSSGEKGRESDGQ